MTNFIINPGTGPVDGNPKKKKAKKAIKQFIKELGLDDVTYEREEAVDDGQGRFGFALYYNDRECVVEMPGLDIDEVRYVDDPDQNIFDFPRLYVDGSSWVWMFAVDMTRYALLGGED